MSQRQNSPLQPQRSSADLEAASDSEQAGQSGPGKGSSSRMLSSHQGEQALAALGQDGALVTGLLDTITSPVELKTLSADQLPQLCAEIRAFLLDSVQQTGGHLGSNLGVVELTVALHYVFDFARDRVIWDVSHQAYVHKILTGRRHLFGSLRKTDGLCGFTHPDESNYDLFHTGHAGTSISLGMGLAMATAHDPARPHVISVIGDASLGAGVAFEALNHAGASGERMLVVLNDNEWSISKSVGALAKYLTKIRSARMVQRAQQEIHGLLQSIPMIGNRVERVVDQVREVLRHSIVQGHVFEELGVTYVGPVDGHDVRYMVENLERVRELDGVVLLHSLTQKGKGHPDATTHPERVHATKGLAKAKATSVSNEGKIEVSELPPATGPAFTKAFAAALTDLAESDLRVHAITAGMPSGTGLTEFAKRFPTRFHDVGICEQHGIALAAGMAKGGLRPVVAVYSTFMQRGFDQVFQEVALQGLPVVFALDRAGLVGQDGPTHNGVFDLAMLRTLPGMTLAAPRDATDMNRMLAAALKSDGPWALRFPRDNCPLPEHISEEERRPMKAGRAEVLRESPDLVIWAYGPLVTQALEVAANLSKRGLEVGVVDARFAKPVDEELLTRQVRSLKHLIVVEEHQRAGGLGSAVLEMASRVPEARARIRILGVPDRFIDHMTSRDEQLAEVGLDTEGIESCVLGCLRASRIQG